MVIGVYRVEYTIPLFQEARKVNSKTLRLVRLSQGKILTLDPIEGKSVIYAGSLISLNTSQNRLHFLI